MSIKMRTFGACGGGANAPRAPPPGYGPVEYVATLYLKDLFGRKNAMHDTKVWSQCVPSSHPYVVVTYQLPIFFLFTKINT